eukprot:CAMPEP_0171111058 /NCGR_PEP_ID=MMETSP0766_2-20121228/73629_1 /TAXON_ID=439317 /ORGANISM="Gambierdiscus australes, Strain CAWD 149" /LENGTH=55 /DNA_ID=CAMNT_0011572997 /DNA_START=32 /DNA_END=196 /DNA_ORIENTATION=+
MSHKTARGYGQALVQKALESMRGGSSHPFGSSTPPSDAMQEEKIAVRAGATLPST